MTNTTTLAKAMTDAANALADLQEDDSLDNLDKLRHAEDVLMTEMTGISTSHWLRPLALAICELIENAIH
jgi:hypothetical protein